MKHLLTLLAILLISGCGSLDYGDLHWSRGGNWKSDIVYFSEDVCDPNGCSHVKIFILGPDINHDEMAGKMTEGIVKGLLAK